MKKKWKKALSWLLSLALVLSLMPVMSLTAYAAESVVKWDRIIFDSYPSGGTIDGITFSSKGGMKSTHTFTAPETSTFTKIVFTASVNPTADCGQVVVENTITSYEEFTKKATWTGNAKTVVFTVGSVGIGSIEFTLDSSDTGLYSLKDDGSVSVSDMSTEQWKGLVDGNGKLTIDLSKVSGSNSVEIAASTAENMMSALTVTNADPSVIMWLKEDASDFTTAWYGIDMPAPLLNSGARLQINQLNLSAEASSQSLSLAQAETLQGMKDAVAIDISAAAAGIDFSQSQDQKIKFYVNKPETWDEAKMKGYYLREDGRTEEISLAFEDKEIAAGAGRYVRMDLSHFSIYVLAQMADQDAPAKPIMASSTADSITLEAITNGEYRRDDGEWQTSPVFTGLSADTEYTFYQRLKGDVSHNASQPSEGASFQVAHIHDGITFTAWTAKDSMPAEAGNYYLANDVTIGSTWNVPSGTTNLCLNGHAIKASGSHRMIEVGSGVKLSLYDEGVGSHKYTLNGSGLATVNDSAVGDNVKTFEGGYITGGSVDGQGGAVLVKSGGTFYMFGGTLIGNRANTWAGYGGAVSVQAGRFEMSGGKLLGNYATFGAVDTRSGGDGFIMKGGEISYNTATYQGGGVCMGGGGIATISGGKITNNTALGNAEGRSEAGGIVFRSGASTLNISGNPIIKDNTKGDMYLWSGKKITVTGELDKEASIGITIAPASGNSGYASGVFTNSSDTSFNLMGAFFSNGSNYTVGRNAAGQLLLGAPAVTLTYDGNGATDGDVPDAGNSSIAAGSVISVPGNTGNLAKEGFAFDGWNTKADGSGDAYAAESVLTISADTTLYAQWKLVHEHAWTYQADGATITATCSGAGTCDVTEGLTLTISAPTALTYDGNAKAASLSTGYNTIAFPGEYTIQYYQGETEVAAADVKNAGAYTAKFSTGTGTGASVAFTITKTAGAAAIPAYVTAWTASNGVLNVSCYDSRWNTVYGQEYVLVEKGANPDWTTAKELNTDGIVVYTGLTPATEYVIYARVKETDNAFAGEAVTTDYVTSLLGIEVVGDSSFVGATCTIVPDPEDAEGLTYQWYHATYDEENYSATRGEAVSGATDPSFTTSGEDIGKYYQVVISKGGKELHDKLIGPISYGIVEFDTLGGTAIANQTGTVFGDKVTKPADPTLEGHNFIGWYKYYDGEEYAEEWNFDTDTLEYGYVILYAKWEEKQPAAVDLAPTASVLTYNGTAQTLVNAGSSNEGTLQYAIGESATAAPEASKYNVAIPTKTDAGTYYVWYKVMGDATHFDSEEQCIEVTISQREVTASVGNGSKEYNGSEQAGSKDVTFGNVVSGQTAAMDYVPSKGTVVNVYDNGSFVKDSFRVVDGEGKDVTANYVLGMLTAGKLTVTDRSEKYQIQVTSNSNVANVYDGNEKSAAGFETLRFTVDGNVYVVEGLTTSDPRSIGVCNLENVISGTAVVKDAKGNDVTAQFTVEKVNGKLEITPKTITVTADGKRKERGEKDPELTYTVTGLVGTDAVTGTLTREAGEDVGTYAILQGTLTAGKNYQLRYAGASLTILQGDYIDPLRELLKYAISLGGERTITWEKGTGLPYDVMKTLQDHPELTVIFKYNFENVSYEVTIHGKDVVTDPDVPWYGPMNLYGRYGLRISSFNPSTGERTYRVVRGDNLTKIARRFNVTVDWLVKKNLIKNPNLIWANQMLKY